MRGGGASMIVSGHGQPSMSVRLRSCVVLLLVAACAHAARRAAPSESPQTQSNEARVPKPRADSTREYRGEWDSGFETSTFRGCNGTVFANVWLTLAPGATAGVRWPIESFARGNTITYYVRVRGILRGPADRQRVGGGYGHLGAADYELFVTRLLDMKPAGEPSCVVRR
jgi:hypothetical protein